MKALACSIGIFLVAVGQASAQAAAGEAAAPAAEPTLDEILAKLPTPGSGQVFVRTIPADVLRGNSLPSTKFSGVSHHPCRRSQK